jgi:hypothetical protein
VAKTRTKPGPKRIYGERRDYHIKLPLSLADKLDEAARGVGIIAYVEQVLREHFRVQAEREQG